MGKSTPEAPDYEAAAEQTAAGNLEMLEMQTRANRPTQITPWGTIEWTEEEGTQGTWNPETRRFEGGTEGGWTQNVTLSPEQQEALEAQLGMQTSRSNLAAGMMGRVEDEFGTSMDWTGFDEGGARVEGGDYYGDRAGEAMYGRATSRLDPQWDQRMEQQEAALRNQGLRPGDEAYDNAMQEAEFMRTDAYQQAGFGADMAAAQEGARMQGMDIGAGGYNTQLRQQQIAEAMQQRGFSLNEINAILHGQQVGMPSMPGFNQAGVVEGADYSGAAQSGYDASMDQFNADQAAWQSVMNAGAGAMSMSDVRLKRSVEYVGRWANRKFYKWTYIWGEKGFGVLAHENPDMVVAAPAGYAMVDYGRL